MAPSQTASAPDSKPPVALFGLDGTYASALVRSKTLFSLLQGITLDVHARWGLIAMSKKYTAAAKTSALDSTSKALAALSEVFKKDAKLPIILTAPTLTPGDKSQIVQELQRHMGGVDKADTVKNFLKTLAENNRLGILQGVCEKFATLMGAARGEVDLTVTSAQASRWCPGLEEPFWLNIRDSTPRCCNDWRLQWPNRSTVRGRSWRLCRRFENLDLGLELFHADNELG